MGCLITKILNEKATRQGVIYQVCYEQIAVVSFKAHNKVKLCECYKSKLKVGICSNIRYIPYWSQYTF